MASNPIRDKQFQTANFAAWLAENGAEIGVPTNRYEVIRYRAFWNGGSKASTHIVYCKDNGLLTYTGATAEHYQAFLNRQVMPCNQKEAAKQSDKPKSKATRKIAKPLKIRTDLLKRDGDKCWYCGKAMTLLEATIEHLIPKSDGGGNALTNLVLAHQPCNQKAGNAPLARKIEIRAAMLSEREKAS